MTRDTKQHFLQIGYERFANAGPVGLKVEILARQAHISKSSFYHHFADMEVFTEILLAYHLQQVARIAEAERQCQRVVPDLLTYLLTIKADLLFHRQLRIHRHIPAFGEAFLKANALVGNAITGIWAEYIGLDTNTDLARLVLNLSLDNFYLQLSPDTLTYDRLFQFITELRTMVQQFRYHEQRTALLYGTV